MSPVTTCVASDKDLPKPWSLRLCYEWEYLMYPRGRPLIRQQLGHCLAIYSPLCSERCLHHPHGRWGEDPCQGPRGHRGTRSRGAAGSCWASISSQCTAEEGGRGRRGKWSPCFSIPSLCHHLRSTGELGLSFSHVFWRCYLL